MAKPSKKPTKAPSQAQASTKTRPWAPEPEAESFSHVLLNERDPGECAALLDAVRGGQHIRVFHDGDCCDRQPLGNTVRKLLESIGWQTAVSIVDA